MFFGSEDIGLGYFRSIDEILAWAPASSEDRSLIVEQTVKRQSEKHKIILIQSTESEIVRKLQF
jgi:predicted Fe-S protein YdhL (DUF1289 family)